MVKNSKTTTTLELSSVRPSTTALYWLPFLDSIDEQVIVAQPVSSALQRQQLYHRAPAEGAFTLIRSDSAAAMLTYTY